MKRVITVSTSYGSIEIVNLKRVWINSFFGYNLMYSDDIYEYNCIYRSFDPNKKAYFHQLKDKLLKSYNNGDLIVEL